MPDSGQALTQRGKGFPQFGADLGNAALNGRCCGQVRFGLPELVQRLFTAALQFGGDQPVVGINLEELPLRECGLILQTLQLLGLRLCHGALGAGMCDYCRAIRIQFHW